MRPGFLISIAILAVVLGFAACGTRPEIPAREVKVHAQDVTLHVRITGDPEADDVLLAIGTGPV